MTVSKVTENLLRRVAMRQGYRLSKSRCRDPRGIHFGQYQIIAIDTGEPYADATTGSTWLSAATVARALDREDLMTDKSVGQVDPVVPMAQPPGHVDWTVRDQGAAIVITAALTRVQARELAHRILRTLS